MQPWNQNRRATIAERTFVFFVMMICSPTDLYKMLIIWEKNGHTLFDVVRVCTHAKPTDTDKLATVLTKPSSGLLSEPAYYKAPEAHVRVDPGIRNSKIKDDPRWFTIYWHGSDPEAYCFHSYCWQLLKENESSITPTNIIDFVRVTTPLYHLPSRPLSTVPNTLTRGLESLVRRLESSWRDGSPLSLSTLLERMLELPREIMIMIWEHLEPCAIRSLLVIESGSVQEVIKQRNPTAITQQAGTCRLERIMAFHFRSIKGARYLSGCGNSNQFMGHIGELEQILLPRQINAVKLVIGPFGIRRLQFQAQDWKSEWVGDGGYSSGPVWTAKVSSQESIQLLELTWDVSIPTAT
jgi:hypothetical protein